MEEKEGLARQNVSKEELWVQEIIAVEVGFIASCGFKEWSDLYRVRECGPSVYFISFMQMREQPSPIWIQFPTITRINPGLISDQWQCLLSEPRSVPESGV
ncbi:unnamed protein product [Leuciscus chuanchicus]